MKIVCISDTHTQAARLTIPECDVLIHAGDWTYKGGFFEIRDFLMWLQAQPAKHKVFIAGNHELTLDAYHRKHDPYVKDMVLRWDDKSFHYLEDQEIVIDGIKFYGTPWTPWFYDWAFNGIESGTVPFTNAPSLRDIYAKIPNDTQIMICHTPCAGIADKCPRGNSDERLGSIDLLRRVQQVKTIRMVVGGHLHEARDIVELEGRVHVNASSLDRDYATLRPPMVFNIEHDGSDIKAIAYEKILPE
jgi:Icc-related predicted phosphoesterase